MTESAAVVLARFKRGVAKLVSEPREWFVLVGDRLVVVVALGFAPLAVLFSFVVRIALVAQHTVAITPFTTPTQEADDGTER